ncbi:uncharacterized protein LOC106179855 [Lingula anatina]|uniref:Uncharacterized protein LOC106179855 n=1 Tax=Lingula anatina TaxID=7574 RepID=A0A1S3K9I0_LINAN|nr:uncharacterized protein LOC106179855 [Lingula anatina]|eukprot:XP_013419099.1 uncharacterized protein LOC106179855 [Lingula anatina]
MAAKNDDDAQDILGACLGILVEEADPVILRTTLQTLLKLMKNAAENPSEEKFHHVRKENKAFSNKVWRYAGAQQFMLAAGWAEADDAVVLTDSERLKCAIQLLEAKILQYTEQSAEPIGSKNKPLASPIQANKPQSGWSDRELTEKEKQIAAERKRQQAQLKREKEERKRISEQVDIMI